MALTALRYDTLAADVKHVTERAVCVVPHDGPKQGERVWIPKPLVEDVDLLSVGDDEVVVQSWFIQREGLL